MTTPKSVTTERHGEVLVAVVDNPPVNALSWHVRQGIADAMAEAMADDAVKAVVLRCAGRTFIAGADISELGKNVGGPDFGAVLGAMENATKPIVAAIHGTALGGGLETALCCHYRIAVPSAQLGVPEVNLGLLPGGGGTQRLPRVVGVEQAALMCSLGAPVTAAKALDIGLVDRLAGEATLAEDAIAFAREVIAQGPRPTKDRPVTGDVGAIQKLIEANARKWKGFDAPFANLRCVEAAARFPNIDEGLAYEREEFTKLITGSQSAAQRHMFFAERQGAKVDNLPKDTPTRAVKSVGVIGAGTMGGGIAMNFIQAGIPVTIVDMTEEAVQRGLGVIRKNYEISASKGRLPGKAKDVDSLMALLTPATDYAALADCDLVIEAVFENIDLKKEVFGKLDAIMKPGAILATNTSFLDVDAIAAATKRPEDVVGMHFFSPANVMKLLEIVRGAKTANDVLATVLGISKTIQKIPVVSGVCHGFIANRIMSQRSAPADQLLREGASPEQIDRVQTDYGFAMGPFRMGDLVGLDVIWHRDPTRIESIRDALCAAGRFGQKVGKGFYDYDEKRNPIPSAEAQKIVGDYLASVGAETRDISDEEVLQRCLYPVVNEGYKLLDEGMAQRASDIDVAAVYGYNWPVYTGGPMFWGDLEGPAKIVAALEKQGIAVAAGLRAKAEAAKG